MYLMSTPYRSTLISESKTFLEQYYLSVAAGPTIRGWVGEAEGRMVDCEANPCGA